MRIINFNLLPTLKAENISQPEKYLWLATKIKIDSLLGRSSKCSGLEERQDLVLVPEIILCMISKCSELSSFAFLLYNTKILNQLYITQTLSSSR